MTLNANENRLQALGLRIDRPQRLKPIPKGAAFGIAKAMP